MKFAVVLSMLVVAVYGSNLVVDKEALKKDLLDFLELLPQEEFIKVVMKYVTNDAEMHDLFLYIQEEEFKGLLATFEVAPTTKAVFDFLEDSGLDVYAYVNFLNDFLGLVHIGRDPQTYDASEKTGGMAGLADEIKAIVPFAKFRELHYYKIIHSPAYGMFIKRLVSKEFSQLGMSLHESESYQNIVKSAVARGIDVVSIKRYFCAVAGMEECA